MRKLGILFIILALAVPLFAVNAQDQGFVKTFDLPVEPAPDGPLAGVDPSGQTVTWWHNHSGAREEQLNELIAVFNDTNPWGITVEPSLQGGYPDIYNKMIAGIPSGDVPSMVVAYQNQAAAYYQAGGLVENMDVYVQDSYWGLNDAEVADFVPTIFTQDYIPNTDIRAGFPPNRSSAALFYNMSALTELGYAGPPTDWDTFREMACKFAEQGWSGYTGEDAIGYTISTEASNVAAGTYAFGGDIYNPETGEYVYNSPATVQFVQLMVDLYNDGCAALIAERFGDQNNFTAGKALFYTGSTSGLPFVRSGIEGAFAEPFEWHVTVFPYVDEPAQDVYGASVSIPKTTPEAQLAAWLFLRWFTEPEQGAQWAEISAYFPVRFSTADALGPLFEDFPQYEDAWQVIQGNTVVEPQLASYDVIREEVAATVDNLLAGGGDVETALTELTNTANEIRASFEQ
jgi:multiple sugar transport system substrate-binding protein/sn-glycerol 3-phosphate transport system substrate-binding protein